MQLSANLSLMYSRLPIGQAMAAARKQGFDAVEILSPYDQSPESLAACLRDNGLRLVLINTPLGPHKEKGLAAVPGREADFLAGVTQALEVCAVADCPSLHVMAGCPPPGAPEHVRDTLLSNVRKAAELAQASGVVLTLEALNRDDVPGYCYWHPAQVLSILQTLNHAQVRLQFDFYHAQKEGLDIVEQLEGCLGWIQHVQFASPVGRHEPNLQHPMVRSGLRKLQSAGYSRWIGAEYIPAGSVEEGLAWRDQFQALLDQHGA